MNDAVDSRLSLQPATNLLATRHADLPAAPMHAAARALLDAVGVMQAAFANGAMAHALDYEDGFDRAPLHPNAALIPALLALAEADRICSGSRRSSCSMPGP